MGKLPEPGEALLERLATAVSRHDVDAVEGCFAPGYRNELPAHPAQGFTGRDQVRRNWEQIFTFVPDITARVVRRACDGDVVWSEWEMTGARRAGTAHQMAGVIVFGGPRRAVRLGPVLPGARPGRRGGRQPGSAPAGGGRAAARLPAVIVVAGAPEPSAPA
jgi:ketosteroid isomerase-like protein